MAEKKGIWKDVLNKTSENSDGGMKQLWVGMNKGYWVNTQEKQTRG